MVPRDQFERMAALALVAIILSLAFACQAYAAETGYIDSGIPPEQGEGGTPGTLLGEVYKFCMWFYYTFIRMVL